LSLTERISERIKRDGPITFRDWMEAALYDADEGYYCRRRVERWGRKGDYRTSPERSPLFAATFARYFAELYKQENAPEQWTIVEFGSGEGHFAEGVLSAIDRHFPRVFAATQYVIDEVSEASRAVARTRLKRFAERVEFGRLADLEPINAGVIFSNEFLDAFPVHRVTVKHGQLRELYVTLSDGGKFVWTTGPLSTPQLADYFEFIGVQLVEEQTAEVNLAIEDWLRHVEAKLRNGYIVTVDYGAEATELYEPTWRQGGTLRAFHRHQFADDGLARPGEQDLTTTIDWTFVKLTSEMLGFEIVEFEQLDRFLINAGLFEELELMIETAKDEAEKLQLRAGAREMALPTGMAQSFQALVLRRH
jgi:SAM-dependent MidA family methyltransferase